MLRIDNLHATVAGKPILNGLSLGVNAREVHEGSPKPTPCRHPALYAGSRFSADGAEGSGAPHWVQGDEAVGLGGGR